MSKKRNSKANFLELSNKIIYVAVFVILVFAFTMTIEKLDSDQPLPAIEITERGEARGTRGELEAFLGTKDFKEGQELSVEGLQIIAKKDFYASDDPRYIEISDEFNKLKTDFVMGYVLKKVKGKVFATYILYPFPKENLGTLEKEIKNSKLVQILELTEEEKKEFPFRTPGRVKVSIIEKIAASQRKDPSKPLNPRKDQA